MVLSLTLGLPFSSYAQNETHKWRPQLSLESTTELQLNHRGNTNLTHCLDLSVGLPIGSIFSFDIAAFSTCTIHEERICDDLQAFSNLDAGNVPFLLSVFGLNWNINPHHSLFFGVRDISSDYFTSDVTSFFTNSSCGAFPTISANYPIANSPMASVALHYRYDSLPFTVQFSLYNGTGYDHFTGRENIFRICPQSDGLFAISQAEYTWSDSHYFLGICTRYDTHQWGGALWSYVEQSVTERWQLIAGYSHAFGADRECLDFVGLGAHWQLKMVELGLFSDYARFADAHEWANELTCKIALNEHFYIQPAIHFIQTGHQFHNTYCLRLGIELNRWCDK